MARKVDATLEVRNLEELLSVMGAQLRIVVCRNGTALNCKMLGCSIVSRGVHTPLAVTEVGADIARITAKLWSHCQGQTIVSRWNGRGRCV